jgi:hypothetical protein
MSTPCFVPVFPPFLLPQYYSKYLKILVSNLANAVLTIADARDGTSTNVPCSKFATFDMNRRVIRYVTLPINGPNNNTHNTFMVSKTALRSRFAHSLVNFGANCTFAADGVTVTSLTITMGGTILVILFVLTFVFLFVLNFLYHARVAWSGSLHEQHCKRRCEQQHHITNHTNSSNERTTRGYWHIANNNHTHSVSC